MRHRVAVIFWLAVAAAPAAAAGGAAPPGEYIFRAAGCAVCHTDEKHHGAALAGGRALETPFGTFYTPNITPDKETGIGTWSEAELKRALREGVDDEGKNLYPAFPYTSYTHLTDADIHAIWTYLSSRKPVRQANKPHALKWYVRFRPLLGLWKALYLKTGPFQPQADQSAAWNRGAYLATAVSHCGECHTPRTPLGGMKRELNCAGNPDGVDGAVVPNITPDKPTGIGRWSRSDLADYLETGMTPDGDFAGDLMADVIDDSTSHLTPDDRKAIAAYILSLPPVKNEMKRETHQHKKPRQKETYE
ncbi:MAG: c-type cytochrome [Bacteroidota bacterium]